MSAASQISPPAYNYENFIKRDAQGVNTISFLVGGVKCAGCIQKIEKSLNSETSIQQAKVNFSTGRLNIAWNGDAQLVGGFASNVRELGFTLTPYHFDSKKQEEQSEEINLRRYMIVSGVATVAVMILPLLHTINLMTIDVLHIIMGFITIPATVYAGRPFFISALNALRNAKSNMDLPISLGLFLTCAMSVFEAARGAQHVYFDSAVMLAFFLLIGRYMDFRARRSARSAASSLLQGLSGFATIMENGVSRSIPIADISVGMQVIVASGARIPVDGMIESGDSTIDTSLVTGESVPRDVSAGDDVYGGTINLGSPLTLRVTKAADDSLLADIVRLMEKAEQGQAQYVRLADRVSNLYTPVVHILALAAFILWWAILGATWQDSLMIAITVLIVTCPCALGLAVPVVQVLASGVLMKRGVLVKSGDALERLAAIDTILFDKTGTLTIGKPQLIGDYNADDMQLAASLATHSVHPLSVAISKSYKGQILELSDVNEVAGKGLEAKYQGKTVKLGSRAWCGVTDAPTMDNLEIWLSVDGQAPVPFYLKDQLKTDAKDTIKQLSVDGLNVSMLSGDRQSVVQSVAGELSMTSFFAELTPVDKYNTLEKLKADGHKVLMVGDGLNDAPVLAGADISMAPGTAIDMAQNAADIVFMGDTLGPVAYTHGIAKFTQKLVKENFALAIIYNFIAVPAAFCGVMTPMLAAIAMSASSLVVIGNSFRLRGYK